MMKKILSVCVTMVLILSLGITTFAASSTTFLNSSVIISKDVTATMKNTKPGAPVEESLVVFSYVNANGLVDLITLEGINYSKECMIDEGLGNIKSPTVNDIPLLQAAMNGLVTSPLSDEFYVKAVAACQNNFYATVTNYGSFKPSSSVATPVPGTKVKTTKVTLANVPTTVTDPVDQISYEVPAVTADIPVIVMGVSATGAIECVEGFVAPDGSVSATFINAPIVISVFAFC